MKTVKSVFALWIIIMILATFTSSLVYVVSQQMLRLGANEIPKQIAVETSIKLQDGQSLQDAIPKEQVDISKSLNGFVMVFDSSKNLIAASGMMGNSDPSYPKGVLDNVDKKDEIRVTWQPKAGLRFASVAIKYDKGFIVAARSLNETEKLIEKIGNLIFMAWLAFFAFSLFAGIVISIFIKKTANSD